MYKGTGKPWLMLSIAMALFRFRLCPSWWSYPRGMYHSTGLVQHPAANALVTPHIKVIAERRIQCLTQAFQAGPGVMSPVMVPKRVTDPEAARQP